MGCGPLLFAWTPVTESDAQGRKIVTHDAGTRFAVSGTPVDLSFAGKPLPFLGVDTVRLKEKNNDA